MSSFQDAHKVANELAEVLISFAAPATSHNWAGVGTGLIPQVLVADKDYRVLEIGYTVIVAGTNTAALPRGTFRVGTWTAGVLDPDSLILETNVPAATDLPAGTTISTSKGGANAFSFATAGTGKIDSDGNAVIQSGDMVVAVGVVNVVTGGNGPQVNFFARLAPIISKDVFA